MLRIFFAVPITFAILAVSVQSGDEKKPPRLKALLITGGGYHDYKALNPVITKRISELARVEFAVKSGLESLDDPAFADGFDIVVYNFCFDSDDKEKIEHALKVARAGKPTMMVHCAMHTFRPSDEWTDFCGMRTRVHDPYRAFSVIKATDHPIVKLLPDEWPTPGDELYQTIKLGDRSTALLKGKAPKANVEHVVCWVSTYGKGRVFATTLGHDLRTVNLPVYHQLLANGLLWACGKLGDDGRPVEGYGARK